MEAARFLDAHSLQEGYCQTQSDAHSAYTQSWLGGAKGAGTPTFVELPQHRWPKSWKGKYEKPVVPLVLSLYGHPDSGGYWEQHCEQKLALCGWTKIENWQSVFFHEKYKALLVVYVDDFKMSAPKKFSDQLWKDMRAKIVLDDPQPPDRFLGCYLEEFECEVSLLAPILQNHPCLLYTSPSPRDRG